MRGRAFDPTVPNNQTFLKLVVTTILLSLPLHSSALVYNITSSNPLFPNETLASSRHTFELGFFRPTATSDNQFIGLWFTNDTSEDGIKILWVANRDTPLPYSDQSAALSISNDGNLQLLNGDKIVVWTTNVSGAGPDVVSYASLSDSGNLALIDGSSGNTLWESFADPSDTLLQSMQAQTNALTGKKQFLTSWASETDPSLGNFVVGITSTIPPQFFTWVNGTKVPYWRSGVWDKTKFNGIPAMEATDTSILVQQDIQQETTYLFINSQSSSLTEYLTVLPNGSIRIMNSDDNGEHWTIYWEAPTNLCEVYGTCGKFSVCNAQRKRICSCLKGFEPKSVPEWSRGNWTQGCMRKNELNCEKNTTSKKDMFFKMTHMKLPDFGNYEATPYQANGCLSLCLSNCSCLGYAYVDTIGCMIWTDELVDIQQFYLSGEEFFLRLDHVDLKQREGVIAATLASIIIIVILGAVCALYALPLCPCRSKQNHVYLHVQQLRGGDRAPGMMSTFWKQQLKSGDGNELPIFDFTSILVATAWFSSEHRLGQGGFGPVYKGKLQDGKEVAVKRLSSNSGQGIEEFKNEISLISKLQHRNLVRLVGCCIEGEEKILIYEYLPNKSLDTFLFDPIKKMDLNWGKRFQIIQGIARGLVYLHRDSNLRVIHRDLKASNILLDGNLNPKISDFGLARMFQGTIDIVNTQKVAGTLGYMAPEYVIGGIFSEKSDVYSFGVLLLEIVSSRKNTSFNYDEEHLNLVSYAWELWRENRGLDLLDEAQLESSCLAEAEKCIQVGLMCVQDQPADRPLMSSVIQMLSGEADLSLPKEPTFTFQITSMIGTPLRVSTAGIVSYSDIQGR